MTAISIILAASLFASEAPEPGVAPLFEGDAAPFTGLLVPEKRFTGLLNAELKLDITERKLVVEQQYSKELDLTYREKLKEATKEQRWYETPSFNRWLGFGIGVVVTVLSIYGGVKIVEATHGT